MNSKFLMIWRPLRVSLLPRRFLPLLALGALCFLSACNETPPAEGPRLLGDETLLETPTIAPLPDLAEPVVQTMTQIREIIARNSLRGFARYADQSDGFASNFAGSSHFEHWSLIRRSGVDPLAEIENLFSEPYATKTVGEQVWYIWPDLAAKSPEDLLPERLNFRDRARLEALIGEAGIAKVRAGGAYPGFRTAIGSDGRWVYFLHETGEKDAFE